MELKATGRLDEAKLHYQVCVVVGAAHSITMPPGGGGGGYTQHHYAPFLSPLQQRSLELDPGYGEVYFNYGNLLYDAGNLSEASI